MQDFSYDSVFLTWNWIENSVVVSPDIYRSLFKSFRAGFSISPSRCWEEQFEEKLSWKFSCFILTFKIEQTVSGIHAHTVKAALINPWGAFWW